jgi:hypothetical protein
MIAFPFFDSFIGSGHKFSDPADVKIRRLEIQSVRPDLKTQEKRRGPARLPGYSGREDQLDFLRFGGPPVNPETILHLRYFLCYISLSDFGDDPFSGLPLMA